jgi:hypothetical protein
VRGGALRPEPRRHQAAMLILSKAEPSRHIACIMHEDAKFSRHGNRGALETGPIFELQAPSARRALRSDPGQHQYRRFVKQRADAFVAALRDVAVIVDLARLMAPRGGAWVGADERARF